MTGVSETAKWRDWGSQYMAPRSLISSPDSYDAAVEVDRDSLVLLSFFCLCMQTHLRVSLPLPLPLEEAYSEPVSPQEDSIHYTSLTVRFIFIAPQHKNKRHYDPILETAGVKENV